VRKPIKFTFASSSSFFFFQRISIEGGDTFIALRLKRA
jgi:hypothetical protein